MLMYPYMCRFFRGIYALFGECLAKTVSLLLSACFLCVCAGEGGEDSLFLLLRKLGIPPKICFHLSGPLLSYTHSMIRCIARYHVLGFSKKKNPSTALGGLNEEGKGTKGKDLVGP